MTTKIKGEAVDYIEDLEPGDEITVEVDDEVIYEAGKGRVLDDYYIEDIIDYLEEEGYTVLDNPWDMSLRNSIALQELKEGFTSGRIPVSALEEFNKKYSL
jgi:hypothetical protein